MHLIVRYWTKLWHCSHVKVLLMYLFSWERYKYMTSCICHGKNIKININIQFF